MAADLLGQCLGFATGANGHLVSEPNESAARGLATVVNGAIERESARVAGVLYLLDALPDRGATPGLDLLRDSM